MKHIRSIGVCLTFLCAMLFALIGRAEEKVVLDFSKWMPERPASVAVVDLQALKIKTEYMKVKDFFKEFAPRTLTGPNELTDVLAQFENGLDVFESQIDKFTAVGAAKAYLFVDSQDLENPLSFTIVVPTDPAKSKEVKKLVSQFSKWDFIPEQAREQLLKAFFIKAYKDCIVMVPNIKDDELDEEAQKLFFDELERKTSAALNNKNSIELFQKVSQDKSAAVQVYLFPNGTLADELISADQAATSSGLAANTLIKGVQALAIELDIANPDVRLQIYSLDARSAKELYRALPVLKITFLNQILESIDSMEASLFMTDVVNQAFYLLDPAVVDNTLNWSLKNIINRLEGVLPQFEFDVSAGLYAPVTDSVKEEANRIYSLAAPFINKQTFAVIHLDTADLDGAFEKVGFKVYDELKRLFPETFSGESANIIRLVNYFQTALEDIDALCNQIHAVGGRDLFIIVDKDEAAPMKLIVPFDKEKKTEAKKLFYFLRQMSFLSPSYISQAEDSYFRTIYKNCLVFGIKNSPSVSKDDFNRGLKAFEAQDVPEIRQAFELSWSYQRPDKKSIALSRFQAILNVQALLNAIDMPVIETLRERLEEDYPELAKQLPEFTDQQLADGVKTAVLEIHPEKVFCNLHVISKDKQSAQDFAEFAKALKPLVAQSFLRRLPEGSPSAMKDLYLDYADSIFDSRILEIRDNVLSIRSNNISEKYKPVREWYTKHGSIIVIGSTAVGLLMPAVSSARQAARNLQNANNYKQLALGMFCYEAAHRYLPLPYTVNEDGKRLHSWRVAILPYLDEQELYDQIRLDEPWDSEWNKQFHDKCPKCFKNPSVNLAPSETTFAVVVGENTAFPGSKKVSMASIMDGCSNTAMIIERSPVCWMDPNSDVPFEEAVKGVNVSPNGIISFMKGFFTICTCDSAVRTLPDNVSSSFLRKLFEIKDGCSIDLDDPELDEQ